MTILLLFVVRALAGGGEDLPSRKTGANQVAKFGECVTNIAQFTALSGADQLAGCDFHLTGTVTLVDTNRDLVVLQDTTGAVAINFRIENQKLQAGQLVTLDGTNCCPLFKCFQNYPYRPSGRNICPSFEAPRNWGEYYLTRMRGWLHPRVTGSYRFWSASDNSSELWLSTDADPARARKIAAIPRFGFVEPPGWSQYPSQRSELIELKAGETYYIEALQEQTGGGDYLSIGWQPPDEPAITVIGGAYLTPWHEGREAAETVTHGILREYWTNFFDGDLTGLGGPRPFESALTVKAVGVRIHGRSEMPKPMPIALDGDLPAKANFRWVEAEGVVKFAATEGDATVIELSAGPVVLQVRTSHWNPDKSKPLTNAAIRVEGVCELVYNQKIMVPGLIWAPASGGISFLETGTNNGGVPAMAQPVLSTIITNPATQGFYMCRGVVTFNDRVLGKDFVFIQQDDTPMLVNLESPAIKNEFKVGQDVDLGGALESGKLVPIITPLVVTTHGWHSMPVPIVQPLGLPDSGNREGKWNELEGVVHAVNSNGTLAIVGKNGSASLWLGQTPSNYLSHYVDAKLSARGVLLLTLPDSPLLLVPSRNFVDVKEAAPDRPFSTRRCPIVDLLLDGVESANTHRVWVSGEVTYRDGQSFFMQDTSGGIRVRTSGQLDVKTGERVDVFAFPTSIGSTRTLAEALVRPAISTGLVKSKDLDMSETWSSKLSGTLVTASALLLARKTNGPNQVLELQEPQRIFIATLAMSLGRLPDIAPGSRLRVTGVCDDETTTPLLAGGKSSRTPSLASLNMLLRGPQDVVVLSGPPWWGWRKTVALVGTLLTILLVTLSWVHLLHRRLDRQRATQLAFSQHVLERLEDERRRIAVNLHDSLGQYLLLIKNHAILAIQRPQTEDVARQRLDEISSTTSQAIEEVRQITHGLRPYQLDRLGLTQAIRALVNQASKTSATVFASRVENIDGRFNKDAEIHVYRIAQEAVTNVVKHASATEAAVVIKQRATVISLSIRDNGRGFNLAEPSSQSHDLGYGLSGIAERVRILGGELEIVSRPSGGTNLTVEFPISNLKA